MPSNKKLLQAAAGSAGGDPIYVEDVFSTYLYAGNGAYQTITNGIDLLNEGGLVWVKSRTTAERDNYLWDTARGYTSGDTNFTGHTLSTNTTSAEGSGESVRNLYEDGYQSWGGYHVNMTGQDYVSWTFRKAKKFFDVVTYTGDGTNSKTISHNLGSVPAMMFVKHLNGATYWLVYDGSQGYTKYALLNSGQNFQAGPGYWAQAPTSTSFTVGDLYNDSGTNGSGGTYVAYLFASDAGGFGDDGTESIIKCGTYTGTGGGGTPPVVNLGFEPQWLLVKNATTTNTDWLIMDTMRGFGADGSDVGPPTISPNTSGAEFDWGQYNYDLWTVNATGFTVGPTDLFNVNNTSGDTYIYMAIRMPMKTPTVGTEVYTTIARAGNNVTTQIPTGFTVDMFLSTTRNQTWYHAAVWDRLRSPNKFVITSTTQAEQNNTAQFTSFDNDGITVGPDGSGWINNITPNYVYNLFKRATGFFDVVAYTGNGTAGATQAHNLGVVPEMLIVKRRNATDLWPVYHATLGNTKYLQLNGDVPEGAWSGNWNNTTPTASVFSLGNGSYTNASSSTYVAYLFASVAGVSKVGSYTGTGSSLNVDCGFTGGARFILIRRYNYPSGGSDWYTWDSVRGISAGNDPYLLLNDEAVEVTGTDYVDPLNAGFTVTSNASSTVNVNGGTYIFLAIA